MARVIKGAKTPDRARRPMPRIDPRGGRKVIEREVYAAQQQAEDILREAEARREQILAEGRQKAAQAREEAQAEGAQEAFEKAAQEALVAFRRRADRYAEASDDIRALALEVALKVLGSELSLTDGAITRVINKGMAKLRARRTLRVLVPPERLEALQNDRPILMDRLELEPDLVVESIHDVSPGFARIVTEVGGALMREQAALDSLAEALEVDESAVAPRPHSAVHAELPEGGGAGAERTEPAKTYDDGDSTGPELHPSAFDEPADGEEATEFLSKVKAARKSRTSAVRLARSSRGRPAEVEQTLALDVSQLREDLTTGEGDDEDDLDLFADDSVMEP